AAAADEAQAAVLVVAQRPAGRRPPVLTRPDRALVRAVHARLGEAGIALADVLVVTPGRFRSLLCVDQDCCPTEGRPLGDLRTTVTGTTLLLRGRTLVEREGDLVADVRPRPWPLDVAVGAPLPPTAALERWRRLLAARTTSPAPLPDPPPEEVAWLAPALADVGFRDAVLVDFLTGAADIADEAAAGRLRGPAPVQEAETRPPDREVLEAGRALLAAVARGAPAGWRAEALALLAWQSWWLGSGARARLLAALALADRPGHRLALLVDELLLRGVRPAWIRGVPSGPDMT
ncbi:MAG TPA: DUF4192 family protein, partial [Kineosporiaceae bacterium]|nr:DUF4192 family protein [Kineosporiaceae bacterium]